MRIVTGSDHTGFEMKRMLSAFMTSMGHEVSDVGAYDTENSDYPTFGRLAADKLAAGEADRAVLVCGTGYGISLAANSVKGVRCVNCSEPYTAMLSRRHNNANALALGARVVGPELAKMIVEIWLNGDFEGGRHGERVRMIEEMKG